MPVIVMATESTGSGRAEDAGSASGGWHGLHKVGAECPTTQDAILAVNRSMCCMPITTNAYFFVQLLKPHRTRSESVEPVALVAAARWARMQQC